MFNYRHESVEGKEVRFFQGYEVVVFNDSWLMEDIAVHCGIMPSKTRARKNKGWSGPIPPGFSEIIRIRKGSWKNKGVNIRILNRGAEA